MRERPGGEPAHMARISVGDLAPTFTLTSDRGEAVSLAERLQHGPAVLIFYVLDNTPG